MTSRMRLFNPNSPQVIFSDEFEKAQKFGAGIVNGMYLLECIVEDAPAAITYGEIDAPNNVFDGTTTPAIVSVVSDDVNDALVGTGAQKLRLIGLDENDEITTENFELNGTTEVNGITKWKRIFHSYIIQFGSGGTTVGNVIVKDATNTYLTIKPSTSDSNSLQIYVPSGWFFRHRDIDLRQISYNGANDLSIVFIKNGNTICCGQSFNGSVVKCSDKTDSSVQEDPHPREADNGIASIIPYSKYAGAAETFALRYVIVLRNPSERGLDSGVVN